MASTTDPPKSAPPISGKSWASDTRPTSRDEWVSWYTWYGTATVVSWVPSTDTSSPRTSRRRSRDRRSGAPARAQQI